MPQAAEQCALPKTASASPIAAAAEQQNQESRYCLVFSLLLNQPCLNGTSLFRSILVGRNFRHIPRWLDYRRWRHNFRFLFLGFGVHNVGFSLLPLGVNRLLKLTFLTRAGPAALPERGPIDRFCVFWRRSCRKKRQPKIASRVARQFRVSCVLSSLKPMDGKMTLPQHPYF